MWACGWGQFQFQGEKTVCVRVSVCKRVLNGLMTCCYPKEEETRKKNTLVLLLYMLENSSSKRIAVLGKEKKDDLCLPLF